MTAAAFGYLTPVQGALLQELIDVAVILGERFRKDDRDLVEVLTGLEAGDKVMLP